MLTPSPFVGAIEPYSPPAPEAPVDLRLDGNEGRPPPAGILEEVVRAGPEIARRYPDARPLEREIAGGMGLDPGRVIVTAGGDDAIERAMRSVLAPGREVVLPVPTFEMMERYAQLTGCKIAQVPWREGPYPVAGVLAAITRRTAMVVAVTPNSPTGLVATAQDLERISAAAPSALLLVDLAYVEFADVDLTKAALALPLTVVVRSLSKAWGLAGLRVGWAAGDPEVIGWMRACGHPYSVSGPSLRMAAARLATGRGDVERFASRIRVERAAIAERLGALGVAVIPSQANFVLARFEDAGAVRDRLAARGIGVRIFPGRPMLEGCLRITLPGDEASFERLAGALESAVGKEAT